MHVQVYAKMTFLMGNVWEDQPRPKALLTQQWQSLAEADFQRFVAWQLIPFGECLGYAILWEDLPISLWILVVICQS